MMSVRGLVRAIFDEQRPPTPPRRLQRRSWDVADRPEGEATYVAKRFEGEYNVCFRRKPLGVGLVPSSQLYGSWEVSSVQEADADTAAIARGDVLIAVNFSCRKAQLPRARLAAYLRQCTCPIVMTLRNPEIYGSFDSRAMSTAMYPASVDYHVHDFPSKVAARASAMQWRRSLEHDLALNAQAAKNDGPRQLAQALVSRDINTIHEAPPAGIARALEMREMDAAVSGLGDGPTLSELGEFDVTFNETPLHLALAPSTRLYGSVEVYDPKHHAPTVQVGDVIMAVNDYSSMSQLSSDEVIDAIAELQAPVTLRFRRPVAYRHYLAKFFQTKKKLSSQSIASAMFPPSAEYKKKVPKPAAKKASQPGVPVSQSFIEPETTSFSPKKTAAPGNKNEERARELKAFATKIGALDQFKLWAGGESPTGGRPLSGHESAFLTEKHMQFIWKNLPSYLTCNQMELIFTTRVHGWNFLSFFDRLENKGPTIMVVQDEHENIFGVFCSASWKRSKTFFGNGRTFVFSLSPQMNAYLWSGMDSSFMYAHRDAIFVGGGNKGIALCLQLDDRRGFTHACTTFDSPPLVDYESFRCETIEVWGFHGLKV
ncbi:TLD domain-containing protein 2 [Phytophthora ramorum]|uniref:TLDc domain-containing protein n=1 Tax=Phytophthora ramorum TaxID=164328 RepID=H3GQ52_PHYRM|nr:TLD domain-containing protein 2 [Phytophthora ramorum]